MATYGSAAHEPVETDRMTNTAPYVPDSDGGIPGRIGIVEAERLVKLNRLRELTGVGVEANPAEVKAA